MFSNKNCGLSSTHAIFLLGHIFLCKKSHKNGNCRMRNYNTSFAWISCNVIQTVLPLNSPARSAQITLMKLIELVKTPIIFKSPISTSASLVNFIEEDL